MGPADAATGRGAGVVKIGGLCGVIGPILALALVFAATALSSSFRWQADALSDLGVSDVAPLFNGAVIIGGLLTVPFALGVRRYLRRTVLTNLGTIILVVGGISLALVGVFTLNTPALHGAVALGYFVLAPIGLILISVATGPPWYRVFTIAAGVAALVAILVLPFAIGGVAVGFAVPEIVEALILAAWFVVTGRNLLRSESEAVGTAPVAMS